MNRCRLRSVVETVRFLRDGSHTSKHCCHGGVVVQLSSRSRCWDVPRYTPSKRPRSKQTVPHESSGQARRLARLQAYQKRYTRIYGMWYDAIHNLMCGSRYLDPAHRIDEAVVNLRYKPLFGEFILLRDCHHICNRRASCARPR